MNEKKPLLKINNLQKSFVIEKNFFGLPKKTLKAVNDISFEINESECFSIVGESGCGKSTTARLVLNLIKADGGSVIFNDIDLLKTKGEKLRKLRKNFQMIFQNPYSSLDPRFKIFDSIAEPLLVHQKMKKKDLENRVYELLALVELDRDIALKYPHECSGGQNQRVSIARALALSPSLVVADEAVSALDVSIQWKILNLIKDLQKKLSISFLFIAHNLAVVKLISDRVAVMYLGEIVEIANVKDLFENPLHPYTQVLINSAPVPDPARRDRKRVYLRGEIPKPTEIPSGCPFHTRCPIAKEECSTTKPQLKTYQPGHLASCLLLN